LDIGAKLLLALCKGQETSALHKAKLGEVYFSGQELELYQFIRDHTLKHGVLPKPSTLAEWFPGIPSAEEPWTFYLEGVEMRFKHRTLNRGLTECSDLMKDKEYDKALARMQAVIGAVQMSETRQQIAEFGEEGWSLVKQAYNLAKQPGAGIGFGWPYLDDMTGGVQGGDVISYVGRPATGKTYLQLYSAHHMWWNQHKNILFCSQEMSILPLVQRLAAIHSSISVTEIKQGSLPKVPVDMEKKLAAKMLSAKEHDAKFWVVDGNLSSTADDIYTLAAQLKPDAIFIDGAYLLRHRNAKLERYVRVAENVEDIKKFTAQLGIPTICTYQFKREASKKTKNKSETPTLEDIAYSDAIGQTSSIVLGLFQEDTVETIKSRQISVLKGREGETGQFSVGWDFHSMNFREIKPEAIAEMNSAPLDYL
jgi:replicative DNA helicase